MAKTQAPAREDSPAHAHAFGVTDVEVSGFRSAREVSFSPGPMCALVAEASGGKSNLLAAIRAALDPGAAPLTPADAAGDGDRTIAIRLRLAGGGEAALAGTAERHTLDRPPTTPPVLFLPAAELYLRAQAQRYLYRLLREFSSGGNQVIYSTHSPAFLNVAGLDELVFVERIRESGTRAAQPEPVTPDEDFRVLTEFDAVRSELFLARAAVLVEGQTEKLVLVPSASPVGEPPASVTGIGESLVGRKLKQHALIEH